MIGSGIFVIPASLAQEAGPVGLIGHTKKDSAETVACLLEDHAAGALPARPRGGRQRPSRMAAIAPPTSSMSAMPSTVRTRPRSA